MFLAPIRASSNKTSAAIVSAVSPPVPPPPTPVAAPNNNIVVPPEVPPSLASRQSAISSSMFKGQASYASGVLSPSVASAAAAGSTRPSPPFAVSVTTTDHSSIRSKQLAERLARPSRTKEEIAASIKARHEASTKRREEFITTRQSKAASSAASAVASLTSSLEAAAAIKAQQLQQQARTDLWGHLDEELTPVTQRTKRNTVPKLRHSGGVAFDFGHLVATPKATDDSLWSDTGILPQTSLLQGSGTLAASPGRSNNSQQQQQRLHQHSPPPQPSLLKRLLEKSPQRVSAVSRMVKNAAFASSSSSAPHPPQSFPIVASTAAGSSGPSAMPSNEDLTHDILNSSTYSYASEDDHLGDEDVVDEDEEDVEDEDDEDDHDYAATGITNERSHAHEVISSSPLNSRLVSKPTTGLTPEAISATLRSASAKRSEALEQRRSAARAQVQAVTSRLTLLHQTQAREKAKKRVVAVHGPDAATLRRAEKLLERAKRAIEDAERAAAVSQRVKAARRLQSWFRFRKILHLGDKEAEGGEHEARTAVIDELVRSEQQQQQEQEHQDATQKGTTSSPRLLQSSVSTFTTPLLVTQSSSSSIAATTSSLHDVLEAAKAAVNTVLSPASKRSVEVLQRAISGQPSLDNGGSLEAARIAAAEEEIEAYKKAGRQPPPPVSPRELPAAIPYGSFDDCALAIQQRSVLAAAQVCTTVIMRAYSMLDEQGATTSSSSSSSSSLSTSFMRHDDNSKSLKNQKEKELNSISFSAALRPSVAKSPRTLLAALLIAYFPNEILYTGFDDASSSASSSSSSSSGSRKLSASKQQRNDELVVAAKNMLAALHSFCGIVLNDAEQQQQQQLKHETPSSSSSESKWWLSTALGATSRTIGARSLAYGLDGLAPDLGLDASAFVSVELRIALQQQQQQQQDLSDADRHSRVIHSLLAFNQTWVKYMDAFMVWKLGDGMRISQTLALPFRRLALKRMELYYESNTKIGEGDAGLEQLREGVENQLAQLRAQLVSLLGADGAVKWEKDQIASMEAERVREVKSAKAQTTSQHARKESQGISSSSSDAASVAAQPSSLSSPGRSPSASSSSAAAAGSTTLISPSSSSSMSSTTPRRVSASPSMPLFKQVLGNEVLAHELLLDPTFRLPEPATGEDLSFYEDEELDDDDDEDEIEAIRTNSDKHQKQQQQEQAVSAASGIRDVLAVDDNESTVDIERALSSDGLELGSSVNSKSSILHTASIHDRTISSTPVTSLSPSLSSSTALGDTISSFSEKVTAPSHSRSPVLTAAVTAAVNDSQFTNAFNDTSSSSSITSNNVTSSSSSSVTSPAKGAGVGKRGGRRHTVRGKLNMARVAQDPQLLRMSAGFWEASLRAAEDHATAEIKAEVSKQVSAAIVRGLPPPTSAPPLTQHHAVDLVCASLESVRDSIISVLPNRPDIQSSISSKIDPALFKRMLLNRAFSHADWLGFLRFVANTIMSLEAPVRQEDTKKWLAGAEAHVKRIAVKKAEQLARQGRVALNAQDEEKKSRDVSSASSSAAASASRTPVFGPAIPALVLASAAGSALDSSFSLDSSSSSSLSSTAASIMQTSAVVIKIKPILDSALLSLLPRVLAWAHFKISLIKLDTSNYHLMTLAPFLLQGGKGAEYEKARFDEKLAKGEARLSGTKLWYAMAVDECVAVAKRASLAPSSSVISDSAATTSSGLLSSLRQAITRDSKLARLIILRDGILSSLLAICEHPLTQVAEAAARNPEGGYVRVPKATTSTTIDGTTPSENPSSSSLSSATNTSAAAAATITTRILPFPETLHLDAKRLQDLQNVIQRSALVVTLSAITQQIVSTSPVVSSSSSSSTGTVSPPSSGSLITTLSDLQKACVDWLKDESLRMQDLTTGFLTAADAIARSAGRSPFLAPFPTAEAEKLGEKLSKSLLSLISKAVATNHPLYSAFSGRILEYVRYQVTHLLQETLPTQSANSDVDTSDGASSDLAVYWKRLAVSEAEIPLQGVKTSVSPHCKKDIMNAVDALARLLRHNHAVYDERYRSMQALIRKEDADDALRLAAEALRSEAERATMDALAAASTGSANAAEAVLKAGDVVLSAVEAQRAASALRKRGE